MKYTSIHCLPGLWATVITLLLSTLALGGIPEGSTKRGKPTRPPRIIRSVSAAPIAALPTLRAIEPLSGRTGIRPVRPLIENLRTSFLTNDPIRFAMTADKDSVAVGEGFEITIRAELLDIPPSLLFSFEEQKAFSLKVIMPDGFVQTGGTYYDLVNGRLEHPTNSRVEYTLKGHFSALPQNGCFMLIRGTGNATNADLFIKKSTLCIKSGVVGNMPTKAAGAARKETILNTCADPGTITWYGDNRTTIIDHCYPDDEPGPPPTYQVTLRTINSSNCQTNTYQWYVQKNNGVHTLITESTSETLATHVFIDTGQNVTVYKFSVACSGSNNCTSDLSPAMSVTSRRKTPTPTVTHTDISSSNSTGSITVTAPVDGTSIYKYSLTGDSDWQPSTVFPDKQKGTYSVYAKNESCFSSTSTIGFARVSSSRSVEIKETSTPNTAPIVANAIPGQNAVVGQAFTYTIPSNTFSDAEGDVLTYSATSIQPANGFSFINGVISGTPSAVGAVQVTIRATDPSGLYAENTFTITVGTAPTICAAINAKSPQIQGDATRTVNSGTVVTLTVTGCDTYTTRWYWGSDDAPFTPNVASEGNSASYSFTATSAINNIYVKCIDGNCTSQMSNKVSISVNTDQCASNPSNQSITSSADNINPGSTITLTANNCNATITWSNNLGSSAIVMVNPTATTTYSFSCSYQSGCVRTASKTVTVNTDQCATSPNDQYITSSAGENVISSGSSVTLTANNCNATITWSNNLGSSATVSVAPTATTAYSFSCTYSTGCVRRASKTVSVNTNPCAGLSIPTPTITGVSSGTVQTNTTLNFYADCGAYYTRWYNGLGCLNCSSPSKDNNREIVFSGTETVTIYARCANSDNTCTGYISNGVNIQGINNPCANTSLPTPGLTTGLSARTGETLQIAPSCSSGSPQVDWGNTGNWMNASPTPYTTPVLSSVSTYNYQARCVQQSGQTTCSGPIATGSVGVRNNQTPNPSVTSNQSGTVGQWMSFTIPSFNDPDGDNITYTFTPAGIFSGLTANGLTISGIPNNIGSQYITLTGNDGHGGTASVSFYITVREGASSNSFLTIEPPVYNCNTKTFFFKSSQPNGATAPVEYFAIGLTNWTTNPGPYNVDPFNDAGAFQLQARLQSNPSASVSLSWKFQDYCTAPASLTISPATSTVCAGESPQLTTAGCSGTVIWSTGATGPTLTLTNLNSNQTLTATCAAPNGLTSISAPAQITVKPRPNPPVLGTTSQMICLGQPASLSVGSQSCPGGAINWSTGGSGTSIVVTPATAGNFRYEAYCQQNGCASASESLSVIVNPIPNKPTVTVSPGSTICAGSSATLTASNYSGALTWVGSPETTSAISVTPTVGIQTYTTYCTDKGCQSDIAYSNPITIIPLPSIQLNNYTICAGQTLNLAVSGCANGNVQWSNEVVGVTNTVSPSSTTGYSVTCTINGCSSQASTTVTVNPAPLTPTIRISGTITCNNPTVTLSASSGYDQYVFTGPAINSQLGNTAIVTGTGVYSVIITDARGCTALGTSANVVADLSPPTITRFTNDGPLTCAKNTVILTAVASNGASYSFYGPSPANNSVLAPASPQKSPTTKLVQDATQPTLSVSQPGQYTVVVTAANGCTSMTTTTVGSDTSAPGLTFSNNNQLPSCSDPLVKLTFSGATNYTLTLPSGETKPNVNSGVWVSQGGIYTLTGQNSANGCINTAQLTLTENKSKPLVSLNRLTLSCDQPTALLVASVTGSLDNLTYLWSGAGSGTTQNLPVSQAGTYVVTVTNHTNGCSGSATSTVGSNTALPEVSITTTPATTTLTCSLPTIQLIATSGYRSYRWSTGETAASIPASQTGTYTVSVTGLNGCVTTATQTISQDTTPPALSISASATQLTCDTPSISLTANTTSDVLWSTGDLGKVITIIDAKSYSVTVTGANGCTSTASITIGKDTSTNAITVIGATTICEGQANILSASASNARSYTWTTPGPSIVGSSVSTTISGRYTITATFQNGCRTSEDINVTVNPLPTPTIGGNSSVCQGSSTTLTVGGGASYRWSTGASTSAITVTEATSYSVVVSNVSGCSATTTVAVSAFPKPTFGFTSTGADAVPHLVNNTTGPASTSVLISTGGFMYLSGFSRNNSNVGAVMSYSANGNVTYQPTPPNGQIYTQEATAPPTNIPPSGTIDSRPQPATFYFNRSFGRYGLVNPNLSGTVSQTFTPYIDNNANNQYDADIDCTGDPIFLTYYFAPQPTALITANQGLTLCAGQTLSLSASGGSSYQWNTGASSAMISVSATGVYSVTAQAGPDTWGIASVTVTAAPAVTATLTGNLTLCAGQPTQLTATGGTAYQWSNGTTTSVYTATATGIYSVTVTNASGCTATTSISVTALTPPAATLTASGLINCNAPTVRLTTPAIAGASYSFSGPTGSVIPSTGNQATVNTTGAYSVLVTSAQGCTSTATTTVLSDNSLPLPGITASQSICAGQVATITASGGASYQWNTGQTTATLSVSPTQTTIYSVIVTATNGCTATAQTIVTVNALPTPTISGNLTICLGNATQLTASGGSTYQWSTGANTATISVSPTNNTAYNVTVTTANGCSATTSRTVTVNTSPVATLNAGEILSCAVSSVVLTAGGGGSYSFSGPTGSVIPSTGNQATVNTTGAYSVLVTSAQGCTNTATTTVTSDNSIPTPGITASQTICAGQVATITASGGSSYQWSTGANTATINVSPAQTTTYSVIVRGANGCQSTTQTTVTVQEAVNAPTINTLLGGTNNANSLTLTAMGCPVSSTVLWKGPNNTQSTGATWVLPLTQTSTFTVYCQLAAGCTSQTGTVSVSPVNPPSPIMNSPNGLICAGQSYTLNASGCTTPSVARWSTGETGDRIVVAPSVTTNYSVSCAIGQVINPTPATVKVTVSNPLVVTGRTVYSYAETISLTATSSLSTGVTYAWTGPNGYTSTGGSLQIIGATPVYSGTYSVAASSTAGCAGKATVTVSVTAISCAGFGVSIQSPTSLTSGQTLNLTATVTPNNTGVTYAWSGPASFTSSVANPTIANATTANSGTYSLTVNGPNGCTATATASVSVNPPICASFGVSLQAPTSLTSGQTLNLTATVLPTNTGVSYVWTGPASFSSNAANPSIANATTANSGTYALTANGPNGCTATATANVSVNPPICASFGVSIQAPTSLTSGQTLNLTATVLPTNTGVSYTWRGPASFSSNVANPTIANATTANSGTYSLTVNGPNGCTATATVSVSVNPPICASFGVSIQAPTSLTSGQTLNLTATVTPNNTGVSYVWRGPASFSSNAANLTIANATTANSGTYSLTVNGPNGCTATATASISVVPPICASFGVSIQAPASLTSGQTLNLTATVLPTNTGVSYTWRGPASFSSNVANPTIANATTANSGSYSLTVNGPNGCTATATASVSVVPPACFGTTVSIQGPTSVTATQPLNLTATVSPASTSALYAWSGPASFSSNAPNPSIPKTTTANAGAYTLLVTVPGGCTAIASLTVVISPIVSATDCNVRIVARDANGTETDLIPRTSTAGGGVGSLTLTAEHLDGANLAAHQYQWGRSTGTATALALGSSPVVSATAIGVYSLSLTPPSGSGLCTATLTLRSKPCQQVAHTYQCGKAPATTLGNPNDPKLSNLAPGDTIRTGDFDVVVISITGGGSGGWTGTGYTQIPYLGNSKIAVELKGAVVNDCYALVGGIVQSAYDPSWGGLQDVTQVVNLVRNAVTNLIDLYSNYTGTQAEKDKIRQESTRLCESISNKNELTEEQLDLLKTQCNVYNNEKEGFLACPSPTISSTTTSNSGSGRIATINGSCKAEDLIAMLQELDQKAQRISESTDNNVDSEIVKSTASSLSGNTIKLTDGTEITFKPNVNVSFSGGVLSVTRNGSTIAYGVSINAKTGAFKGFYRLDYIQNPGKTPCTPIKRLIGLEGQTTKSVACDEGYLSDTLYDPIPFGGIITNLTNIKQIPNQSELEALLGGKTPVEGRHTLLARVFLTDNLTKPEVINRVAAFQAPDGYKKIWLHFNGQKWVIKEGISNNLSQFLSVNALDINALLKNYTGSELDKVATAIYELSDLVSKSIEGWKIPEYAWNCDKTGYKPIYSDVYGWITFPLIPLRELLKQPPLSQEFNGVLNGGLQQPEFAALAGIWDGVVGIVQGVPDAVRLLSGAFSSQGWADAGTFYQKLSNYDNSETNRKGVKGAIIDGLAAQFDPAKPCVLAHSTSEFVTGIAAVVVMPSRAAALGGKYLGEALKIVQRIDALADKLSVFSLAGKLAYTVGGKIMKPLLIKGKLVWRVFKRVGSGEVFENVDWSLVRVYEAQLINGKTIRVLGIGSTATEDIKGNLKRIITDEEGNLITDANGVGVGELQDGTLVPVREGAETISNLLARIKNTFPNLSDDIASKLTEVKNIVKLLDNADVVSRIKQLDNTSAKYTRGSGFSNDQFLTARDAFLHDLRRAPDNIEGSIRGLIESDMIDAFDDVLFSNWMIIANDPYNKSNLRKSLEYLRTNPDDEITLIEKLTQNSVNDNLIKINNLFPPCPTCYTFYQQVGKLRRNIFEGSKGLYNSLKPANVDWDVYFSSFEAHHIFPKELIVNSEAMQHYLRYYQGGDILDFNGIENGVMLKKYSSRRGWTDGVHASHSDYTKRIQLYLDSELNRLRNLGYDNVKISQELNSEIKNLSNRLKAVLIDDCVNKGIRVNELPTSSSAFQKLFN